MLLLATGWPDVGIVAVIFGFAAFVLWLLFRDNA